MKTIKILTMAALALLTVACSNNDIELAPVKPADPVSEITITATLNANDGATTRTLSENGNKIKSTWETTDQFAILFNDGTSNVNRTATVSSINNSSVTITFTIPSSLANNTPCKIVYPASAANATNTDADVDAALATQNGALATAPDVRVGTATIDKTNHSLSDVTKLAAQNAIFKFTLKDIAGTSDKAATEFKVSDESGNVLTTVTPGSATNTLYVALPVMATGTYWFSATVGSKPYIAKATVSTATTAGKYYQTQVNMATLGDLMGANGKFYADAAAITAASTTAIGVIAYLGTDNFTENGTFVGSSAFVGHGLVLCLKNAAGNVCWSTETSTLEFSGQEVNGLDDLKRATNVSGYTNTTTLAAKTDAATKYPAAYRAKNYTGLTAPAGTTGWFLPSAQQWVKIQTDLGGLSESNITWENSWFDTSHTAADKWETALAKAGTKGAAYDSMTDSHLWYWSSSEYSEPHGHNAVYLNVDATKTGDNFGFCWNYVVKNDLSEKNRVRPVLAF